jgi:hypothetical protein
VSRAQASYRQSTPEEDRNEAIKEISEQLAFVLPTKAYNFPPRFSGRLEYDPTASEVVPPSTPRSASACSFCPATELDDFVALSDHSYEFNDVESQASWNGSGYSWLSSLSNSYDDCTWRRVAPDDSNSNVSSLTISSLASSQDSLVHLYSPSTGEEEDNFPDVPKLTRIQSCHPKSFDRLKTSIRRHHPSDHVDDCFNESCRRNRLHSPVPRRSVLSQELLELLESQTPLPGAVPDYETVSSSLCY